jgi:hypothetical protein
MAAMLRVAADLGSLIVLVMLWVMVWRAYPRLPSVIPIHFGLNGRPDRWGGKGTIWLLPIFGLGVYGFGAWFNSLTGPEAPPPAFAAAMAWMRLYVLGLFYFLDARTIEIARGRATRLGRSFLPITLALMLFFTWVVSATAPRSAPHGPPAGEVRAPG